MDRAKNVGAVGRRLRRAALAAVREVRGGSAQPPATRTTAAAVAPGPKAAVSTATVSAPDGPVTAPYAPVPPLALTVAVGAGPRISNLLAPEWRQRTLERRTWREALDGADLVVLEGVGGSVPGWGDAAALRPVLETARDASIPTLLWVTDDTVPGAWSAAVDVVGASAVRTVQGLSATGREPHHWGPAAQPRTAGLDRADDTTTRRHGALVVIDGLSRLTDDSVVRLAAGAVAPMPRTDTTVVRSPGKAAAVTLPGSLAERLEGSLAAVGAANVLLDLSATSSTGAWTTLEAAAAQTPVVGTDVGSDLPDELDRLIPRVGDPKLLRSELVARIHQPELVAREGLVLQRAVLAGHTGAHRARALADAAGLATEPVLPATISAVVPTNRTHELDNVFANIGRQDHPALELVLVLHGLETDDAELRRRATAAGVPNLEIVHAEAALTLGACMNLGVAAASGQFIAKMDDDNFYGPRFLSDLLATFGYTDAGIAGKWAHYVWLRSTGAVVLRYPDSEHRYERRVQGGSMLFAGDVARSVRFSDIPRAVDSDILDRAMAEGVRVYSGDRYNYVSIRGSDRHTHTWTVADSAFLTATGRLLFYGDPTTQVSL